MPIIEGFLVGFAMIVFVGPVLFTILQITLEKGFWAGFSTSFGVFISDVAVITICYFGAKTYLQNTTNELWISILGIIILWSIGLKYILKPNLNYQVINKPSSLTLLSSFIKGFLVNFVNPFVFGVWIAVIGIAKNDYTNSDLVVFLITASFAVLFTDTIKVVFAEKIRKFLKPDILEKIYKFIGYILIIFSFRIIYHIVIVL